MDTCLLTTEGENTGAVWNMRHINVSLEKHPRKTDMKGRISLEKYSKKNVQNVGC
jgi:hypothetical protein